MKKIASQMSWEAKVSLLNGGNGGLPPGCSVRASVTIVLPRAFRCSGLEREQQQQRDQQREDAERFGHGEPEDQVAELALRGRGVAQRGGEIMAEDRAEADACAAHADAGDAGTDVLGFNWIHNKLPF